MSTAISPPKREQIRYSIASSRLTLDIILNESKTLNASGVAVCLSGALAEARKQDQSSLLEGVFSHNAPPSAPLRFGVAGGIYVNELTWADVVTILQGLQSFYMEREQYMELLVYLEDEQGNALGDASLSKVEAQASDANHKSINGQEAG